MGEGRGHKQRRRSAWVASRRMGDRQYAHSLHRKSERAEGNVVEHPEHHEAGLRTKVGVAVAVDRDEEGEVDERVTGRATQCQSFGALGRERTLEREGRTRVTG